MRRVNFPPDGGRGWKRGFGASAAQGGCRPGCAAQGPISGSYTGAARRGASETPPAGGSDLIGPETPRLPEGLAAGVNACPTIHREKVPKPGTDAGKMPLAAERCFYPTCRLPCIVGRAISPAGQPSGRRKAAGKIECVPQALRWPAALRDDASIVPYAGVLPAGSCCVGADGFHRPGNAAIAGRSRGGRERPPYDLPGKGAKTGNRCR